MSVATAKEKTFASALVKSSYGKSLVRLTKINRSGKVPTWKEITVETELAGPDFGGCYYEGDNSKIVATDSIKNTVYVIGAKNELKNIEEYGLALAKHFLNDYKHVDDVNIRINEDVWRPIPIEGGVHPTSFAKSQSDLRYAHIHMTRKETKVTSGIDNLIVAKITNSEFAGHIKDAYTTLKDTHDRIFGTKVEARWVWKNTSADFNGGYEKARKIMLETFANHHSLSAQQTLFAMGDAVLAKVSDIEEISLTMPNLHRIPFDLEPLGMENKNEVFVTTSEPHGTIKGTLARKK
ncbi:MAG: urate oxidase [Candidatus Melainabacteria bacterium]|nr:urate oxidase [Candidatus Melainabacteria bacterium]